MSFRSYSEMRPDIRGQYLDIYSCNSLWNRFCLCVRRCQRRCIASRMVIFTILLVICVVTMYIITTVCGSTSYNCSIHNEIAQESSTIEESSPFLERPITHAYDVSVRQTTSALWPNGCTNEVPIKREQCTAARLKIMFVKTHKCASSTVSAAILRFALNHNLEVALPKYDLGHIGWPSPYRPYHVWGFSVAGYGDVLAHHIVYDRCYVRHDFPKTTTIYATILRHPFQQFKSAVNFFRETRKILPKKEEAVVQFLLAPEKYEKDSRIQYGRLFFGEKSVTRNMMATDLGFPNSQHANQSSVDLFADRLDKDFDLIMIEEYFDESMVLFRRLMCWELKDLLYLKLNRNKSKKYQKEEEVTESMMERHRDWSNVDYAIYERFNETFWQKIADQGDSFNGELAAFRAMVADFNEFCASKWNNMWLYPPNEFTKQITMTREDCRKMTLMPWQLTPTLWMVSNSRLIRRNDNPFNTRSLWTNQEGFDKWY